MFGKIIGGLFGKGGTGTAGQAVTRAKQLAEDIRFRPATIATSVAGAGYDPATGALTSTLDPALQNIQDIGLGGAGNLFGQVADFDPSQRASQIFGEQAALLEPEFERQRTATRDAAFGSGRLGMLLGGEQPEFAGMAARQAEALANLAANSRQQAYGEMGALSDLGQAQLQAGMTPATFQQTLFAPMLDTETARSAAQYAAGQLELDPYATKAQMQQDDKRGSMDFVGSLFGAVAPKLPFLSDVRLKKDIKKIKVLSNGINVYSWNWIDESINDPTVGVLAQEIIDVIPEAVKEHESGYYKVDYSHPELKGIHNV